MTETVALQPWDETPMRAKLMEVLVGLERVKLSDLHESCPVPGIYAQFFSTTSPRVESILSPLVATGRYPAYIGVSATNVGARVGRYRQSISGIRSISEREVHISLMPCQSDASALFVEAAAISALRPPLQGSGWGAKVPGSNRKESSPADALFPGRRWATPADPIAEADARLRVLLQLIHLDPTGPRWPAIPRDPSPSPEPDLPLGTVTRLADRR